MDPHHRFCHNERCWAYGRAGEGHIVIHSRKERRYKCKRCGRTFSATKGTALYRAHKPHELVVTIVTLLAYGCPPQAIVAAFSLEKRTVCRWQREKAGGSACGFTNTSLRPEGCSWGRFRPTSCVSGSSAAWCGWPRRFRSAAGCGLAAWCEYGATGT
jgi:hypothetical protein